MSDYEVIKEGYWICPNCQTRNQGSAMTCHACGATRGEVEFFYDEQAAAITDAAEIAKAEAGPDWLCAYCGTSNEAGRKVCKQCAGNNDQGRKRTQEDLPPDGKRRTPNSPIGKRSIASAAPAPAQEIPAFAKYGCAGILAVLAILGILAMWEKSYQAEIVGTKWERTIGVDQYLPVRHQDWKSKVPLGARTLKEESKIRTYRDVLIGHRDVTESYSERVKVGTRRVKKGVKSLGNGRFKETYGDEPVYESRRKTRRVSKPVYRKDPVYDTEVTYEINEWKEVETKRSVGTTELPSWPATGITGSISPAPPIGTRREGKRTEKYTVTFTLEKDPKSYEISAIQKKPIGEGFFLKLRQGTRWSAIYDGLGNLLELRSTESGSPASGSAKGPP